MTPADADDPERLERSSLFGNSDVNAMTREPRFRRADERGDGGAQPPRCLLPPQADTQA